LSPNFSDETKEKKWDEKGKSRTRTEVFCFRICMPSHFTTVAL
jgi:hypothetical protein